MTPAARLAAAIEILESLRSASTPVDRAVPAYFKVRRYAGSKDRAAVSERVYGILRRFARLSWALAGAGAVAPPGDWGAADFRAVVAADLVLSDGLAAAEVDALFGAGKYAPPALTPGERRLVAALAGGGTEGGGDPPDWVRRECPEWLHGSLAPVFGRAADEAFAELNRPAPVVVRANALSTTRDAAAAALAADGVATAPTRYAPHGLVLDGRPDLGRLAAWRDGLIEVQDEGSQIVALLTDARPGQRVLDFCGGAGGKALALAAAMENRGEIVVADVDEARLRTARRRLRRAGVTIAETRRLQGGDVSLEGSFDRVLVDVPCSGTGTWRRAPDLKWRFGPDDLADCIESQRRILAAAWALVAPGGRLVYATCSLLPEENEAQAARFAAAHGDAAPLAVGDLLPRAPDGAVPADGPYLRLMPHRHGTDGFFAAVFRRA